MRPHRIPLAIALALLTACTGSLPARTRAGTGAGVQPAVKASASPEVASEPSPSRSGKASDAPASPVPPSVPPAVASAVAKRRGDLDAKLALLAQSSFSAARTQALQREVGSGGAAIANGSGVISNNSGSLVSDHGGGLISNNGGSLVAQGYRLTSADEPTISLAPEGLEKAGAPIRWTDGSSLVVLRAPNQLKLGRAVGLDPSGQPFHEFAYTDLAVSGSQATLGVRQTYLIGAAHVFGLQLVSHALLDLAIGAGTSETGNAHFHDPASGVDVVFTSYSVDFTAKQGTYVRRIEPYGLVETGRYDLTPDRGLLFYFEDPLQRSPGEVETRNAAGEAVYSLQQRREDDAHVLVQTIDLLNGFVLTFRSDDRLSRQPAGKVALDGAEVGSVTRDFSAEGGVTYTVALADDPGAPLVAAVAGPPRIIASPSATGVDWLHSIAGSSAGQTGLANGDGLAARFNGVSNILAAGASTLYLSDSRNHRICLLTQAAGGSNWQVVTFAGGTEGTADGPAASASFGKPRGLGLWTTTTPGDTLLAVDPSEDGSARIRAIRLDDPAHPVTTLAGGAAGASDGEGAAASFRKPGGLAIAADGTAYLADEGNCCIRTLRRGAQGGLVVGTLAGHAGESARVDGEGASARFVQPTDVAWDEPRKTLWVAERDGNAVRAIDLSTPGKAAVRTVATGGAGDYADGPLASAGFGATSGIAVDAAGNVLISDYSARRLRLITPAGEVRTLVGRDLNGPLDGPAHMGFIGRPWGIAVLPTGDVAIVDNESNRVCLVDRAGGGP